MSTSDKFVTSLVPFAKVCPWFVFSGSEPAMPLLLLERDLGGLPEQDDLLFGVVDQVGGRKIWRRRTSGVVVSILSNFFLFVS